jgi:hypothetical protein
VKIAEAADILETLLHGVDPITGEIVGEGVLTEPEVMRALHIGVVALRTNYVRPAKAESARAGQAWTSEEDAQLVSAFRSGTPRADLAKLHERSAGAIASRLVRLGEVVVPETVR